MSEPIRIEVTPSEHVTAIAYPAAGRRAGRSLILAHGAGANQKSAFMVRVASALAARGIDTVTFNFLYSEARKRVPDRNDKLEACWRKMIEAHNDGLLGKRIADNKLAIGGKSMGGRIASQVAASIAFSGEVDFRFAAQVDPGRLGRDHAPISGKPEIGENASTQTSLGLRPWPMLIPIV